MQRGSAAVMRTMLSTRCADGTALALEYLPAAEPVLGACLVGHALMANRRTLDCPRGRGLGSVLAAAGFHTYLVDLRGHGDSRLPHGRDAHYDEFVSQDVPALVTFVRGRHPDVPLCAVGHSLFAQTILVHLGRRAATAPGDAPDLRGVVAIAANVWTADLEPSWTLWAGKRTLMWLQSFLGRVFGYFPARALRMGSENVARGVANDLARWAREGAWAPPAGNTYPEDLACVPVPVLGVLGSADWLFCHRESGRRFHDYLARAPRELRVVGAADLGYDPGHMELVRDPRSAPLWRDVAAWLAATLAVPARQQRQ